jgi:hypothetical protein
MKTPLPRTFAPALWLAPCFALVLSAQTAAPETSPAPPDQNVEQTYTLTRSR